MIDTSTDAVKAMMDGVTAGPWTEHNAGKHPYVYVCGPDQLYYNGEVTDKPLVAYVTGVDAIGNRAFIAAARDLVPALLAERDDLRAKVQALVDALERIESITVHSGGEIHGVTALHWQTAFEMARDEAAIALAALSAGGDA